MLDAETQWLGLWASGLTGSWAVSVSSPGHGRLSLAASRARSTTPGYQRFSFSVRCPTSFPAVQKGPDCRRKYAFVILGCVIFLWL